MLDPQKNVMPDLQLEIDRLKALNEWQPIESAPKDGTTILVILKKPRETLVAHHSTMKDHWITCSRLGYTYLAYDKDLDGWMPLPQPPERED